MSFILAIARLLAPEVEIKKIQCPAQRRTKRALEIPKALKIFSGLEEVARRAGSGENHYVMIARQSAKDKQWC